VNSRQRHLLLPAIAAAAILGSALTGSGRDKWQQGEDQRRADYIFMEAQRQNALENTDAYFELLNRAYSLDTAQTSLGNDLGYIMLMTADNDTALFQRGYDMMTRHFDAHPDDTYSARFYGAVNDRLRRRGEALRVWSTLDSLNPNNPDITLKYAEALSLTADTANVARAISVYDRMEAANGKELALTSRKIRAYHILGDTASMSRELHELLQASPRSATCHIYAGDLNAALGRTDSALYYYNRACALDSTDGAAYLSRANLYRAMGDSVAFDREVFTALRQDNLDLESKLDMFKGYIQDLYADTTQRQRINDLFGVLIEQHPHEIEALNLYCAYLVAINDYHAAADQTMATLDIDPSDPSRWLAAMSFYLQTGDNDKAIAAGQRATHYHPDDATILSVTGTAYSLNGDNDKAIEAFNRALAKADTDDNVTIATIYGSMGDHYYKTHQPDSAFACYERAVAANPANLMSANNYAYFLACDNRDLDRAEQLSAICVRGNPENATYLDTYAWIFFKKGEYAKARQYIDAAMAAYGDDIDSDEVLHHAGDIYFMDGKPDEALDFWKRALKISPDNEMLQRKVKHKTFFYK
jgi:tetratricopeptide (TPR) repeat protein